MTNTELVGNLTRQALNIYRTDEEVFLEDLRESAERYDVLRIGRFLPGGDGCYAAAYVLRRWAPGEWVTHIMIRVDDTPGEIEWTFQSGHYKRDFDEAVVDLEQRY